MQWSLKARLSLIGVVAVLDALLVRQVVHPSEPMVRFGVIDVPAQLQSRGYTGDNLAREIIDEIHAIRDSAGTLMREKSVVAQDRALATTEEIKIGIAGPSITVPVRLLGAVSDWVARRTYVPVAGEIVIDRDSRASLHLRLGTKSTSIGFEVIRGTVPQAALHQAAEFVLRVADPYILASYLMRVDLFRADSLLDSLTRSENVRVKAEGYAGKGFLATDDVTAERMYRLSLRADPSYEVPYVNLGSIYLRLHLNREALAITDSTPHGGGVWASSHFMNRAATLCELEQFEAARASALSAIALRDGPSQQYFLALAGTGLGEYGTAIKALELAEALDPGNASHVLDRATLAFAVGDSAAFRLALDELMARDTGYYHRMGTFLAGLSVSRDSALILARHDRVLAQRLSYFVRWLALGGRRAQARYLADAAGSIIGFKDSAVLDLNYVLARLSCHEGRSAEADTEYSQSLDLSDARRLSVAPRGSIGELKTCQRLGVERTHSTDGQ
jgi:tetratricopeptide (TPR) repeat protein